MQLHSAALVVLSQACCVVKPEGTSSWHRDGVQAGTGVASARNFSPNQVLFVSGGSQAVAGEWPLPPGEPSQVLIIHADSRRAAAAADA